MDLGGRFRDRKRMLNRGARGGEGTREWELRGEKS